MTDRENQRRLDRLAVQYLAAVDAGATPAPEDGWSTEEYAGWVRECLEDAHIVASGPGSGPKALPKAAITAWWNEGAKWPPISSTSNGSVAAPARIVAGGYFTLRSRKSWISGAMTARRSSKAKWPVSKKRTTALGLSRLNASAPGGKKNGSFLPHTARSGPMIARKPIREKLTCQNPTAMRNAAIAATRQSSNIRRVRR